KVRSIQGGGVITMLSPATFEKLSAHKCALNSSRFNRSGRNLADTRLRCRTVHERPRRRSHTTGEKAQAFHLLSALRFKINLIAQSFQPADQIAFQSLRLQSLEIIRPQLLVVRITGQDMVNRDQDFVRYGDHGAFMSSSRFEAIIFLAKVTILHAGGGD